MLDVYTRKRSRVTANTAGIESRAKIKYVVSTTMSAMKSGGGSSCQRSRTKNEQPRDPATGWRRFYGEFRPNAQGEDVVAGTRTPRPLNADGSGVSLEETMPEAYAELVRIKDTLEKRFRDMQDLEFTIEDRKLYLLQTRNGKRTGFAAVRIATDMVDEGLISQ